MREIFFWVILIAVAVALIPLGWWGIPILIFLFGVAGTKLGFLDWKEFYESLPF